MVTTQVNILKKKEPKIEFLNVERYAKGERLHHWVHVLSMLVFFFTGLELFIPIFFVGDYLSTRTLHFFLGILIGLWDQLFFGYLVIKNKHLHQIIPTPRDFLDLAIIALCAVGILPDEKYPHYDFYIPEEKRYVMKYHPAQKILTVSNLLMISILGITGISLAETLVPGSMGIFGVIVGAILFPLSIINFDVRFLHFLVYLYFIISTLIHFYFAVIPANRNRLRGMVTGKEMIPLSSKES